MARRTSPGSNLRRLAASGTYMLLYAASVAIRSYRLGSWAG
jgi:hypothetical protein